MKFRFLMISFLLLSVMLLNGNVTAHEFHEHITTEDQCENPSQTVEILADPDNAGELRYDKTELFVDKNACVKIIFRNKASIMPHDLTVDSVTADDFAGFHIHLTNNTDGFNGTDTKEVNIKTPDKDDTYKFYCSIPSHEELGMYGDFIIGEGTTVPGFSIDFAIIALLFIVMTPIIRRKHV